MMWIADSRPRSESGTESCRMVLLNTALMTSAAPATARKSSASQKNALDSPNAVMAAERHSRECFSVQRTDPSSGQTSAIALML